MKSDKIKSLVPQANKILASSEDELDAEVIVLLDMMVKEGRKSPIFTVAIVKHLEASGVDILEGETESHRAFDDQFKSAFENLSERDLKSIGQITGRLFN